MEDIVAWLKEKRAPVLSSAHCLVVIGPASCGKTTIVNKCCITNGFNVYSINSHNCQNSKELLEHLEKSIRYNLLSALEGNNGPKVVIIDDIDILVSADRCCVSTMYEFLTKRKVPTGVRFICISSVEKRLGDLKRYCRSVILGPAAVTDIIAFLGLGKDGEEIAKKAEGSYAKAALLAATVGLGTGRGDGGEGDGEGGEPFELLYKAPTPAVARHIVEEDVRTVPLRFHENLLHEMATRAADQRKSTYLKLLWNLVEWDVLMVSDEDIAIEHFVQGPCTILPSIPYVKKNGGGIDASDLDFTKLLSKLSLQRKNARQLYQSGLPWQDAPYLLQKMQLI